MLLAVALTAALVRSRTRAAAAGREETALASLLVFVVSYAAFVANGETLTATDNLPNRAIPQALLAGHGVDLGPVVPPELHGLYAFTATDRGLSSAFPPGTGLLVTPYYALARSAGASELEGVAADRLEKHAAALLCAFAVVFFFLAAAAFVDDPRTRVLLALALATGTPLSTSLAQGLWSQTGEIFLLALALLLVAAPRAGSARQFAAGGVAGIAVLCRPTAILLTPLVWASARRAPRAAMPFAAGVALGLAASSAATFALTGSWLGSYVRLNAAQRMWSLDGYGERLAGVLLSPSRGLVWYFPALVAATAILLAGRRRLTRADALLASACAASVVAFVLLTACYRNWWGGHSLGPRLLAELALPSVAACALALPLASRAGRVAVVALLSLQSVVHLRLSGFERAREWSRTVDLDRHPEVLSSWRDGLLAAAFVPGWSHVRPSRPYFHAPPSRAATGWRPLDLDRAANADYSARLPPEAAATARWHLHLPRFDARSAGAAAAAGFRFLPPGRPNAIRLCGGESVTLALRGGQRLTRLAAVLAWRGARTPRPWAGSLHLRRPTGEILRRELRLGHEVFDPTSAPEPPDGRLLAGSPADPDELVRTVVGLPPRTAFSAIEIHGPPPGSDGCLYVLALSAR